MLFFTVGSTLTRLGLYVCGGAVILVVLAFVLFRLVTSGRSRSINPDVWEPQDPLFPRRNNRSSRVGIPSTGYDDQQKDAGMRKDPEDLDNRDY